MPDYSLPITSNSYPTVPTVITSLRGVVDNTIQQDQGLDLLTGYPGVVPAAVRSSAVYYNKYTANSRVIEEFYFYPSNTIANTYPQLSTYINRTYPSSTLIPTNEDGSPRNNNGANVTLAGNIAANIEMITSNAGSIITFGVSNATSNTASIAVTINNRRELVVASNVATSGSLLGIGSLANISSNIPASSSSVGTKGQIAYSSGNVYICVATNTWVRTTAITSF